LDVVEILLTGQWQEQDKKDFIYKTTREKFNAVIEDVTPAIKKQEDQFLLVLRLKAVAQVSVALTQCVDKNAQTKHKLWKSRKAGVVTITANMAGHRYRY
jgi:preprotein translocase subunit SecA